MNPVNIDGFTVSFNVDSDGKPWRAIARLAGRVAAIVTTHDSGRPVPGDPLRLKALRVARKALTAARK